MIVAKVFFDPLSNGYRFSCPKCGQHFRAGTEYLNSDVQCTYCGCTFRPALPETPMSPEAKTAARPSPNVDFSSDIIEGDVICPHCWNSFSEKDVLRISVHPDLLGDPVLGNMEQKRFVPAVFNADGIPLDEKNMPCPDLACPHCRLHIPESIVDNRSRYISIVGAPSSGKSYYLTTLIHELRRSLPEKAGFSFSDVDPRINKTLNEYEDIMFMSADKSKVITLQKTEQVGTDFSDQTYLNGIPVNLPKPFIFQQIPILPGAAGLEKQDTNVIFYDNAGEHFQPGMENISNPATLHLVHSDAIFFIFDPLNDADMRAVCDPKDPQINDSSKLSNQTVLFSEMVSRIRRHSRHAWGGGQDKSPIPLIVLIGKYDTWEPLFPLELRKMLPFRTNTEDFVEEFDEDMLYQVSYAARATMNRFAPGIVSQAEAFFSKVLFLPVSSFGTIAQTAEADGFSDRKAVGIQPGKLASIWVDIPYYALLGQQHLIRCRREAPRDAVPLTGSLKNDKVVFVNPLQKNMEQLPADYAGRVILIGGKKYLLPGQSGLDHGESDRQTDYFRD